MKLKQNLDSIIVEKQLGQTLASVLGFSVLSGGVGHILSQLMILFTGFPKKAKFLSKTRLSDFQEYRFLYESESGSQLSK